MARARIAKASPAATLAIALSSKLSRSPSTASGRPTSVTPERANC